MKRFHNRFKLLQNLNIETKGESKLKLSHSGFDSFNHVRFSNYRDTSANYIP